MDILPNIEMEIKEETKTNEDLIVVPEPEPAPAPKGLSEPVKLKQADIFVDAPKIKEVKEPKKKRVLSEEHKLKLQAARQKALEVRRANASMKKEMKDLEKQAKQQKLEQLREQVTGKPAKKKVEFASAAPASPPSPVNEYREPPQRPITDKPALSQEVDLEQISLNAIMNYEKIRKGRKKKKKEEQETQRQHHELKQQLHRAVAPPQQPSYTQNGHWDDFF